MKARLLIAFFALVLIAAPQYAAADSITVNGATFTLTLLSNVGNTYNYQYHIDSTGLNCPTCTILYAVAFKAWNNINGSSSSLTGSPSNLFAGHNGGENGNGCDGTGSGFYCAQTNLTNTLSAFGVYDFYFSIVINGNSQPVDPAHVKALFGYVGSDEVCTGKGKDKVCEDVPAFVNQFQVSEDLQKTPPPPETPEPASLALLGTGLVGLGAGIRRRLGL